MPKVNTIPPIDCLEESTTLERARLFNQMAQLRHQAKMNFLMEAIYGLKKLLEKPIERIIGIPDLSPPNHVIAGGTRYISVQEAIRMERARERASEEDLEKMLPLEIHMVRTPEDDEALKPFAERLRKNMEEDDLPDGWGGGNGNRLSPEEVKERLRALGINEEGATGV